MITKNPAFLSLFDGRVHTGAQMIDALAHGRQKPVLVTRVPALDRLEGGGLSRATVVEVRGSRSSGRLAIGLAALAAATQEGEAVALVDAGDHLDPAGAQAAGVRLERCLWARPRSVKTALLAAEYILSAGFALTVLDLGSASASEMEFPSSVWLRLAKSVEETQAILLIITSYPLPGASIDVRVDMNRGAARWAGDHRLLAGLSVRVSVRQKRKSWHEHEGAMLFQAFADAPGER